MMNISWGNGFSPQVLNLLGTTLSKGRNLKEKDLFRGCLIDVQRAVIEEAVLSLFNKT